MEKSLYESCFEHDNCGIGAVANIDGHASRQIVENALGIVEKLEHRAGKDAAGETGDGVGILVQVSHEFFSKAALEIGIKLGDARDYGVGMFFFPCDELIRAKTQRLFEELCSKEGLKFLGWRKVPVNEAVLGSKARECMPCIIQGFVARPEDAEKGLAFDRRLYILRRQFEHSAPETYVASLSSRTIVYKGMFLVQQLRTFYYDLQSEDYVSAVAVVHSRFSTNTQPSWQRAHPNRFIAHVELGGTVETVHVKNTGRCRELLVPGAAVYLSDSRGLSGMPNGRKTRYDLVAVEKGSLLINMDSQAPNAAVREWLAAGNLFPPGSMIRPEYTLGDSRFDFAAFTPERALLEVKGVTLEREGIACFPDAPTLRGAKHLRELAGLEGERYVLFVIQMEGVKSFRPNDATDPAFGQALRAAAKAGVHILAYDCAVTPESMCLGHPVPVELR